MDLNAELAATNELQLRAMRLLEHPDVRKAKKEGEQELLESLPFVDPGTMGVFPQASQEITIAALLFALMDPEHPIVLCTELMPRRVQGLTIPGSRAMDDNPDTVYRFMPIDVDGRYLIVGRSRPERPVIHQFSLISETWTTQHNFTAEDIVCDEHGVFTIEIDAGPPAGRTNHIRSSPGASFLHVRDTLSDWSSQLPSLLEIRRVNPPKRAPLTDDEMVGKCVSYVRNWYRKTILLHHEAVSRNANEFPQPSIRNSIAMLVTQAYSIGRFSLDRSTAVVLTLRMGGARYLSVALTNLWGISNDPVSQQASLNTSQAARNDDGSYTFVLSIEDPGVLNWIDPGGLPQGLLFLRWAAIAPDYVSDGQPLLECATVAVVDLQRFLPAAMPKVGPAERRMRLDERMRLYERRWH